MGQPTQDGGADRERWVRDDLEGSARQAQVSCIGLDDRHASAELLAERGGATGVQFDRDDSGAGGKKGTCDGAGPRADVDDEIAWLDGSAVDQADGNPAIELVPSPERGTPGHGRPSASS